MYCRPEGITDHSSQTTEGSGVKGGNQLYERDLDQMIDPVSGTLRVRREVHRGR